MAGTPEAKVAEGELAHSGDVKAPPDRDVLRERLLALAHQCPPDAAMGNSPVTLDVAGGRAGLSVKGPPSAHRRMMACWEARKSWFLATEKPLPQFRARVEVGYGE
jgi:hypothetical protein